jgi:hypothetical protein
MHSAVLSPCAQRLDRVQARKQEATLEQRLRVTLHDLGVRQDPIVAIVVYTIAAVGSVVSVWYLLRI